MRIARVVDHVPAQGRRERVVPDAGKQRAAVLAHAGGPVALQPIQRKLHRAGLIAKLGNVARHLD